MDDIKFYSTKRVSALEELTQLCPFWKENEIGHECENCIAGIALNSKGDKLAKLIAKKLSPR